MGAHCEHPFDDFSCGYVAANKSLALFYPMSQTISSRMRARALGVLRFLGRQVELCHHLAKLEKRTSIHFPHRLAAVDLHRTLGDTNIVGNLLVEAPPCDLNHNFSLPGT